MTKKKRFDMDYEETYRETMYFDNGDVMTDKEVLDRLNQLNDENEKLKQNNKNMGFLFKQIEAFRQDCVINNDFSGVATLNQLISDLDDSMNFLEILDESMEGLE